MKRKLLTLMLGVGLIAPVAARAEVNDALLKKLVDKGTLTSQEAEEIQSKPWALKGLSVGMLAYIDYSFGSKNHDGTNYNAMTLTRGYLNVKKEITPWFKARFTPDITTASNGDVSVRMKYLYADFLTPDLGPVTNNDVRVGLAHMPWLDFEESINRYRMQGTMFQERSGQFNSGDTGVGLLGNFGGKLSKEQTEEVGSHHYNGRYGTYHIGVYNGGGYHASEANQNKVLEGRITVRPLPDIVPGLQLSYLGITGKGNTAQSPTWTNNTGFVSYQSKLLVLTAQYVAAKGQQSGSNTNKKKGYSVFGDFTLPMYDKVSLFARYDNFDPDTSTDNDKQTVSIIGAGYRIHGNSYLIADFEKAHDQTQAKDNKKGQVVLQVSF